MILELINELRSEYPNLRSRLLHIRLDGGALVRNIVSQFKIVMQWNDWNRPQVTHVQSVSIQPDGTDTAASTPTSAQLPRIAPPLDRTSSYVTSGSRVRTCATIP